MKKIAYWVTTGLFALAMTGSAVAYLSRSPQLVEGFQHLGYPLYLLVILGVAKLLGAGALLLPRSGPVWGRIKEWAYAGFSFNLLGAAASHAFSGDPLPQVISPLVFLLLLAASYGLWQVQGQAETRAVLKPELAN